MEVEEESLVEISGVSSTDIENIYSLVQAFIEREIIEEEDVDNSNESLNIEESKEEEE